MSKKTERIAANAARVSRTAEITGVSNRYVRLVLSGERTSSAVMEVYMALLESESVMVDMVKQLVPFKN